MTVRLKRLENYRFLLRFSSLDCPTWIAKIVRFKEGFILAKLGGER
jgi:hypothetical protein